MAREHRGPTPPRDGPSPTPAQRGPRELGGKLNEREQQHLTLVLSELNELFVRAAIVAFASAVGGTLFEFCRWLISNGLGLSHDEPDPDETNSKFDALDSRYHRMFEAVMELQHLGAPDQLESEIELLHGQFGLGARSSESAHPNGHAPRQMGYGAHGHGAPGRNGHGPRSMPYGSESYGEPRSRRRTFEELPAEEKIHTLVKSNKQLRGQVRTWVMLTLLMFPLNLGVQMWGSDLWIWTTTTTQEWLRSHGAAYVFQVEKDLREAETTVDAAEKEAVAAENELLAADGDEKARLEARREYRRALSTLNRADAAAERLRAEEDRLRTTYAPPRGP